MSGCATTYRALFLIVMPVLLQSLRCFPFLHQHFRKIQSAGIRSRRTLCTLILSIILHSSTTRTLYQTAKMCLTTYQAHECEHLVFVHSERCPRAIAEEKRVCGREAMEVLSSVGPSGFNCRTCYPAVFELSLGSVMVEAAFVSMSPFNRSHD